MSSTHTAPRLSELDMKRYSFPCESKRSRTPDRVNELNKSPWPGGYHAALPSCTFFAKGSNVSFSILGYLDWLKVVIFTGRLVYCFTTRRVSSSVLKEVIRNRGTSTLCVVFKCSICWTIKSKNVRLFWTSRAPFAPCMPATEVVNRPVRITTECAYP